MVVFNYDKKKKRAKVKKTNFLCVTFLVQHKKMCWGKIFLISNIFFFTFARFFFLGNKI